MIIQSQVLNKILYTGDASILTKGELSSADFPDFVGEFNYIEAHINQYGNVPDRETFMSAFPDFEVFDVNEDSRYLLSTLRQDKNERLLVQMLNQISDALNNGDVDGAMDIYKRSTEIFTKSTYIESVDIYEDTSRYDEYIDKVLNKKKYYVTTGFPEFDKILGGWDRRNEYATIIARPGQGKTFMLLKMCAAAALQGLTVGLYEGEMEVSKVAYRLDTMISGISNSSLTKGYSGVEVEYKKFLENASSEIPGHIKVMTPATAGGSVGVKSLRNFIDKDNLDMLFVDQHSLLEDDRNGKTPVEKASNISKDLKQLQVMTGIPVITVSQQNRADPGTKGVTTANVSQSDRIGQDSTVVIALDKKDKLITAKIIKARDGGDGAEITYFADLDKGIFEYVPVEGSTPQDTSTTCEELRDTFEYTPDEIKALGANKKPEGSKKKADTKEENDEDSLPW